MTDGMVPGAPADSHATSSSGQVAPAAMLSDPAVRDAVAEVAAARGALADELVRLEASARAAVDVKAKVRRNPGKTAAAVGGTAFVVLGGPRRVFRAARRRVLGAPDPLPPSLLPDEVEKAVSALGEDGAKVRGALERNFANYLDKNRAIDLRFRRRLILATAGPFASRAIRLLLDRAFAAPPEEVARREETIRARRKPKDTRPPR